MTWRVSRAATLGALAVAMAACGSQAPAPSPPHTIAASASTARQQHVETRTRPSHHGWVGGQHARDARVPILMYHVMQAAPPGAPNPELFVGPGRFAGQVAALRRDGFTGVTMDEVLAGWRRGAPLPRRPIVFSFDDGYWSQYSNAAPILRSAGWPGVLNLELNDLRGKGSLKPGTIRKLIADGWEIDSHTISHPDLTQIDDGRLRHELRDSRRALHRMFGVPADVFCYPAGRFDARVVAAVRAAGYVAATTELSGAATARLDPLTLPRVRVSGSDTARSVLARVRALVPAQASAVP
jgi:peptidoglycan/xylan/chitin deacetylase (PgdA/CDA1 family)